MILNEHDKHAAQWLRNLIAAGHLPPGVVDDRDIQELKANDLRPHKRVHLFAGIAGWELALQLAGWPEDRPVWTGSCPCQPFSSAGKRKGTDDERHLWPEMFRLIRECRPPVVFGEQVASAVGHGWLDGVFADLEGEGYACGAVVLGAHSVGAPHIRQRLYWVADAGRRGDERELRHRQAFGADGAIEGQAQQRERRGVDAGCGGAVDGLADLHGERREQYEERHGGSRKSAEQAPCGNDAGRCGDAHGLEFPIGDGWRGERPADGRAAEAAGAGEAVRVGYAPGSGREGQDGSCESERGPWAASRTILCRDGRSRRIPVEPAFFPLADGFPGRVGVLRGAGNAIVPQVAAEFVRACMETAL